MSYEQLEETEAVVRSACSVYSVVYAKRRQTMRPVMLDLLSFLNGSYNYDGMYKTSFQFIEVDDGIK